MTIIGYATFTLAVAVILRGMAAMTRADDIGRTERDAFAWMLAGAMLAVGGGALIVEGGV